MSVWLSDSAFLITMTSLVLGSVALCIRYCFKSKCDNVGCSCWGCELKIHRNVDIEEDIELANPPRQNSMDQIPTHTR
jgi:hypothetical protein